MPIEAVFMAVILVLVLAVLVCIGVIYRIGRAGTTVSPVLDQRLLSIEGSISRSDTTIREEFGRGRRMAQRDFACHRGEEFLPDDLLGRGKARGKCPRKPRRHFVAIDAIALVGFDSVPGDEPLRHGSCPVEQGLGET